MDLNCYYCHVKLNDFKKYIFHLETTHKIENYFVCPNQNCKRTYDKKNRFKVHLSMCYSSASSNSCFDGTNMIAHHVDSSQLQNEADVKEKYDSTEDIDNNHGNEPFIESLKSYLNIFMCNLYSHESLPRSLIQSIIELVKNLICDIASDIHKTIVSECITVTERLANVKEMVLGLQNIFADYDTEYKRLKQLADKKFYVTPVEVKIGSTKEKRRNNNDIIMILKEKKLYMSPLRETLKSFLELSGVLSDILNYQHKLYEESNASDGNVIRNVIQGSLWKELIGNEDKDNIIIPLILYFDDFESGNALGSHAGAYKLGAVYVSIATIPPEKSSRLENIFVSQIFYSNDRLLFGNHAIFNKIIEELKFLEEVGINVVLSKKNVRVKFILVTLSGDNLGLHGILGYFESFMSTHFCRFCLTTKTDSETQSSELNNLRNPVDYESHIENRVGVKQTCVWNNLKKFHVYTNLTCDVMHDLMEGVLRYGMALVIQSLISKQYFSLDRLNSRLKYFKYNTCEKNLPPPIKDQHLLIKSLTMSASEMLCLTRNFVFIVGDLIEENEPVWDYYLLLLEITNVLTSQVFSSELIDYLKGIIEEHHKLYLDLFESKLKPKHHFLIHYPTIIKKIGPPILVSAFKYEAKHKELKKICQSMTSRIDLPLSVLKRCLLKQSFRYATDKGLTENLMYGKFELENDDHDNKDCIYVDWCELNGIRYNVNNVLLQEVNDDIPKYCIIKKIVLNLCNNDILFDCFCLDIITYSAHLKAYKVVQSTRRCIIKYGDLYTNLISILYKFNLDTYVKVDF